MNLFLRLLYVFLRARFSSRKVGLVDPVPLDFRVWLTDQDMFAHMTNSRYMSFSDLGTINFIIRSGSWKVLRKQGWYPVICAQSMTISRMLKTPQTFRLISQIVGWDDTYVAIRHLFMRGSSVHAEVSVIARFASKDRRSISPQEMVDLLGVTTPAPPLPEEFVRLANSVEAGREAFHSSRNPG